MPSARTKIGTGGESIAASYLESHGMSVVARNIRSRFGEVDLVADDGETLVFVEVKTRRSTAYGTVEESVTARKRARLGKTAALYLQRHGLERRPWRVDLVAIALQGSGPASINHVRGIDVGDVG
jgi:putative endonuclease